jgi:hypothetical protein
MLNKTVFIGSIFLLTIQLVNTSEHNKIFDSNNEILAQKVFLTYIIY